MWTGSSKYWKPFQPSSFLPLEFISTTVDVHCPGVREENGAGENYLTHFFVLSDTDVRPSVTQSMKQLAADAVRIEVCDILEDTQKKKEQGELSFKKYSNLPLDSPHG